MLISQLARVFKDAALVSIFEQIIHSYEASPGRGLPIGNLTSQYFANHYLTGLDRWVKEKRCVAAYTRYMDDMVCWHSEKGLCWRGLPPRAYYEWKRISPTQAKGRSWVRETAFCI